MLDYVEKHQSFFEDYYGTDFKGVIIEPILSTTDYYFEHGEEATIKKYSLYRNVENYTQLAMNYYEGRTLNTRNTSGVTGVCYVKRRREWIAQIAINKVNYHLGYFKNKEDAVRAREFANMNGIDWYKENKINIFKKENKNE